MGKITKIEQQKNKKRVNIFIDGIFFCGLLTETAVIFGLKVGNDVNEQTLLNAVHESEVKSAFTKASDFLARRMHSSYELSKKLIEKGYPKDAVVDAINMLIDYGYVDDLLFARTFVNENKKYTKRMLEKKLFERGIDKKIIAEVIGDVDGSSEFDLCKKYAEKYLQTHNSQKSNFYQNLFSSLVQKGFEFETIKGVLRQLKIHIRTDDN